MKKDILILFPHIQMTCLALVLFFLSFVSIVIYAFHSKNKYFFQKVSHLPLEGE